MSNHMMSTQNADKARREFNVCSKVAAMQLIEVADVPLRIRDHRNGPSCASRPARRPLAELARAEWRWCGAKRCAAHEVERIQEHRLEAAVAGEGGINS